MRETIEASEYAALVKKPPKYGNRKTEVDGITFDSAAEARRYGELKLMLDVGEIRDLVIQPRYELCVNGIRIGWYIADFAYVVNETDKQIVEDTKGVKTAVYRLKAKLMYACKGITIREISA